MSHTSQVGQAARPPSTEERETYDVLAVQDKWLPVWDELAPVPLRRAR